MANYHEHTCFTCGQIFDYCSRCVIDPVIYKEEGFCSEKCQEIFHILSKHGCSLATDAETLEALKNYDTTNVTESIRAHIDRLKPELISDVKEVNEEAVVKTVLNNKNNKKKW